VKGLLQAIFCCAVLGPGFCLAGERVLIATSGQGLFDMPVVAAMRNGYFTTEGLEVFRLEVRPEFAVKALLAGEVDYVSAWDASVREAMNGAPIKGVAIIASRPLHFFIARPEIRFTRGLKGKNVGVDSAAGIVDFLTRVAIRHSGFDPDLDLSVIETGDSSLRLAALRDRSIDATVVEATLAIKAEAAGFRRLLHLGDIIDFPISGITVTTAKLSTRRDQIKKVIRATLRGTRFIKQNRVESVAMIRSQLKITPAQAGKVYDASVRAFSDDGFAYDRAISLNMRRAREELQLVKDSSVNQVVDWSVLGEVKLERSKIPFWIRSGGP
jgi:ABC-type nitrate/sulfonate/bicarbonate transport system substrate-binding protein